MNEYKINHKASIRPTARNAQNKKKRSEVAPSIVGSGIRGTPTVPLRIDIDQFLTRFEPRPNLVPLARSIVDHLSL